MRGGEKDKYVLENAKTCHAMNEFAAKLSDCRDGCIEPLIPQVGNLSVRCAEMQLSNSSSDDSP